MKIKFLGTAAAEGWPALFCKCEVCEWARKAKGKNIRTRSSCLINETYLIDFPPDTYMHMLNNDLDLSKIEHLIVTHSHQDHFYPLDLMLRKPPFAYIDNIKPLHVYGNDKVGGILADNKRESSVENDVVEFHELQSFRSYNVGEAVITPLPANHDKSERCLIYMIESDGVRLLYGHDTGYFHDSVFEALKELHFDCIILDCTSGKHSDKDYHMGLPNNVAVRERLLELGSADENTRFIITHFSHNGGLLHEELVKAGEPYGFEVAYDGVEFII